MSTATDERGSSSGCEALPALWRALGVAAALVGNVAGASAADLVSTRPHELVVGASPGEATSRDVDASRCRHARQLPEQEAARVVWQRNIPGGVSGNILVDAQGRIFAAGAGRVTQLAADGALQYSQQAAFSGAVATAMLADGTRAVLTREGRVQAWTPGGAPAFDVELDAPAPSSASALLPLPDGGVLAAVAHWVFEIDATRVVRSYATLPSPVQHALIVAGRALLVDERGRVYEWDRRSHPRALGSFSGAVSTASADAAWLVALPARRSVELMDRSDGSVRELARLDPPGAAPVLGCVEPGRWVVMKYDGSWFTVAADPALRAPARRAGPDTFSQVELLVDGSGSVAWWASEVPLRLEAASGVGRELAEVRCAVPASLTPALPSRLVAACSSGTIWLIGPSTTPEQSSIAPEQ
jgi:hypothetical protein